jgi:hypothetical protein
MVLISINFFVKCMSPFCLESVCMSSKFELTFESEGEDIVAATRAAIAAPSSPLGGRFRLLEPSSPSFLPLPLPSKDPMKSFRNWGVSITGRWGSSTSDTRAETDLRVSDAASKTSVAVSCTEFIHAVEVFLNSARKHMSNQTTFKRHLTQTLEFVIRISKAPSTDSGPSDRYSESPRYKPRDGAV